MLKKLKCGFVMMAVRTASGQPDRNVPAGGVQGQDQGCSNECRGDKTQIRYVAIGQGKRTDAGAKRKTEIHEGGIERKGDRRYLQSGNAHQTRLLGRVESPGGNAPDQDRK